MTRIEELMVGMQKLAEQGCCITLFQRHGDHGEDGRPKNVLTPEAENQATENGIALVTYKIEIAAALSSPQNRAHSTVEHTLRGTGKMVPIRTDDRLGDLAICGIDGGPIKAAAKEAGVDAEEFLLQYSPVRDVIIKNGREGAECLREFAKANLGKFVIAGSHGGSRMEVTVACLEHGEDFNPTEIPEEDLIPRGAVVALAINDSGLVKKANLW